MTLCPAPAINCSQPHRPHSQLLRRSWLALAALVVATCVAAFALLAFFAPLVPLVNAQQAQPPSTPSQATPPAPPMSAGKLSSKVKLVTVYAIVRDKHRKIIPDLTKDDFSLEEDGHSQTISHFIVQSDVPLTLGLLVDTSFSQRAVIVPERKASYTFLDHMLKGKDRAFIIHFDREVELLQDLTSSRPKLESALQLLDTPELRRSSGNGGGNGGGGGRSRGDMRGDTHLYDAIWLAASDLMKKQQGRKALFVLSDGVDRGSKESLFDAVEAAQRADTAVYTIYFPGQEFEDRGDRRRGGWGGPGWPGGGGWPGGNNPTGGSPTGGGGWPGGGGGGGNRYPREPRVDGKKILLQISQRTGGVMFEVSKYLPLDRIFSVAEEGLRNQYELGYTPDPPDKDSSYHMIRVKVKKKDATVQARQGYYSAP
jgi:VWFA-related protein